MALKNQVEQLQEGNICTQNAHVPAPKYEFSLGRNAVGSGEEKSKLTCGRQSCVPKNDSMQNPKLLCSTSSHLTNPPVADFACFASLLYFPRFLSSCSSFLFAFLPSLPTSLPCFLPFPSHTSKEEVTITSGRILRRQGKDRPKNKTAGSETQEGETVKCLRHA